METTARGLALSMYCDTHVWVHGYISGDNFTRNSDLPPTKLIVDVDIVDSRRNEDERACWLDRRTDQRRFGIMPLLTCPPQ